MIVPGDVRLVVDAGPIIALCKVQLLSLLPELFSTVVVPAAVLREVAPRGESRPGAELALATWTRIVRVNPRARRKVQRDHDVGPGEAEAIVIAHKQPATSLLLMDDARARSAAISLGLLVLRTGALLVHAVRHGSIGRNQLARALDTLEVEQYISVRVREQIIGLLERPRGG